ncbi:MAG: glycoside hydrolase family 88 protein [Firmicutes bacterium]|nr:glycoside hydrolase family 88 protein [Bacillota bacterium]
MSVEKVFNAMMGMQRFSWEQGVAAQAALEWDREDWLRPLVRSAMYRSLPDGRLAQLNRQGESPTDACCIGESLVYLAQKDPYYKEALEHLVHWALEGAPRSEQGVVYHLSRAPEFWIDSVYMLPPFLAAAGYVQEALKQLWAYLDALYDPVAGLCRHIWHEEEQYYRDGSYWGVGNGWALAGIARVIDFLPESYDRKKLERFNEKLLRNVLKYMTEDGMFHNTLDDPSSFKEVNLSQMVAYTIYRGVKSGWLEEEYLETAEKLRSAAASQVDEDGFVQNVCGMPTFREVGVAPEAQAFYVLMEAARRKL